MATASSSAPRPKLLLLTGTGEKLFLPPPLSPCDARRRRLARWLAITTRDRLVNKYGTGVRSRETAPRAGATRSAECFPFAGSFARRLGGAANLL